MATMTPGAEVPAWSNPNQNAVTPIEGLIVDESNMNNEGAQVADDNFLLKPYSTLDEPVIETIMRDVKAVGAKLKVVLLPLDKNVSYNETQY